MPELPEIETIKNTIQHICINNTITKINIYYTKLKYNISSNIYNLKNQIIYNIKRFSKYLIFYTSNGYLLIHLGMTGNILIFNKYSMPKLHKHDCLELIVNNFYILRYNDIRKFGIILWYKTFIPIYHIIHKLGAEPLSNNFNTKYLFKITNKTKRCIHNILINNKWISGIGNIYANESLFKSNILPYTPANKLYYWQIHILVNNIKYILKQSILHKGTTIQSYKYMPHKIGNYQKKLLIYKKKICTFCHNTINTYKKYGRTLYYCKVCQK